MRASTRRGVRAGIAIVVMALLMIGVRTWTSELLTAGSRGATQRPLAGAGLPAVAVEHLPLRVVVLDGLARAEAHGPALEALCARGMDLVIDVGFPTKSLPVQSVLWSGLTAQQSGVAMSNEVESVDDALPRRVPGARAVVESWPGIAAAMGFSSVISGRDGFAAIAAAAVAGPSPLVLVHVLEIDEAGHRGGRDGAYRAAAARADALVGDLVARAPDAAWIVLSDHGHVAGGGHGDAEDEVRRVRGCVTPRPPGAPARGDVHLVDVSRHVHDVAGLAPPPGAVGRPLAVAAVSPDRDATLPRPGLGAWIAALVVLLSGGAAAWRWGRPRPALALWPLAAAAYLTLCGIPTLSDRSGGVAMALGAVVTLGTMAAPGRGHPSRVMALAAPATAASVAGALLGGFASSVTGAPALPYVTAAWQIAVSVSSVPLLFATGLGVWLLSGPRTSGTRTVPSGGSDQAVRESDNRHPG